MNRIIIRRERQISPNGSGMTREELRELARNLNVKRGRNTADTIANLAAAGIKVV